MIETMILLGRQTAYNKHRTDDICDQYKPFIKEFSTWNAFRQWQKTAKRPLMKEYYLAMLEDEVTRPRLNSLVEELKTMNNKNVKLLLKLTPREKIFNVEYPNVDKLEIIHLDDESKEDFKQMLERELDPIDPKAVTRIISKIGLSYETYLLYKDELLSLEKKEVIDIDNVIKEKRISSPEFILQGILLRQPKYIKEHYNLCEKYSESWVLKHYRSTLKTSLYLKKKVKEKEMTFVNVRLSSKFSRLLPLVRDSRIADVFMLYHLLKTSKSPIEQWIVQSNTQQFLRNKVDSLENNGIIKNI